MNLFDYGFHFWFRSSIWISHRIFSVWCALPLDLHPENANLGRLLDDIQEIDARFYVFQSDHRRLWNEAMARLEKEGLSKSATVRRIEPRTTKWGDEIPGINNVDLLTGPTSAEFHAAETTAKNFTGGGTGSGGYRDSFSPVVLDVVGDGNDDSGNGFVDVDILNMKDDDQPHSTAQTNTTTTTTTSAQGPGIADPFAPSPPSSEYQAAGSDFNTPSVTTACVDPFAPVSTATAIVANTMTKSPAETSSTTATASIASCVTIGNKTSTDADADHEDLLTF